MRYYSHDSIACQAAIVQRDALAVALVLTLGWIGCAVADAAIAAVALGILSTAFAGISAGAWVVAYRMR